MEEVELKRRDVLGAMSVAGSAGAIFGSGTAAAFADRESFVNNLLSAGQLDLEVDWSVDGGPSGSSEGDTAIALSLDEGDDSGVARFDVSLPENGPNNPAYAWLRLSCPFPSELLDDLAVELRYDCQGPDATIASGSLGEVADTLRNGVLLDGDCDATADPGSQACLQPGEPLGLALEWALDSGFQGTAESDLTLSLAGRQCRNQDGSTNPFAGSHPDPCPELEDGPAISWVAFCAASGETIDTAELDFSVDGDTLTLTSAPATLESVVLKYATEIRVFDSPGTSGTFSTTSGGETYAQQGSGFDGTDRTNSTPCPGTCGVKYESDTGFEPPESKGCSE